jgi:GDP-L-fucose synthase
MILVTGGTGMVGSALKSLIPSEHFTSTTECDLRNSLETERLFSHYRPSEVIHLAARVGGIKANMENLGEFYYDNIMINTNVLEASRKYEVKKVVSLLSTCIYPDEVTYPLMEEQIHAGTPHESNFSYAYAKRMLDVQSRAYRKQYGCNFITAVPNNLFGENDNFDLEDSHVIPAMIRKIYHASLTNEDVPLWGDGSPLREFTYSKDLATILMFLLKEYDGEYPINIGNTKEYSIKEVAQTIAKIMRFNGKIIWQTEMPSGQHKKPSDSSKFKSICDTNYTDFEKALRNTCNWFIMNYPSIRGITT